MRDAILEVFHKVALNILSSTLVNQIRNVFRQHTQTHQAMLLTSGKYALGNVCVFVYTENFKRLEWNKDSEVYRWVNGTAAKKDKLAAISE